jgi:hypothetical protein
VLVTLALALWTRPAWAGPPYVTDDPEPTDYRHWEIYTGTMYENDGDRESSAGLPFAEFNYGALPNVQVSVAGQLSDDRAGLERSYAYGITEFGIKTRFVQESAGRPQISFYPSVQVPSQGGHIVTFLPVWLQKSAGPWTFFGGGGLYLNPGPGMRNYTFLGGAAERALSPATSLGIELYHQGSSSADEPGTTASNIGLTSRIGAYHAILFSFGRALHGRATFSGYGAYEFALGPGEAKP